MGMGADENALHRAAMPGKRPLQPSAAAPSPDRPFSPAFSDRTLDFTTPEAPPAAFWHSSALQPVASMEEEVSIAERLVCSERLPERGWEPPCSLTAVGPAFPGRTGMWASSGLGLSESQQELEAAFRSISPGRMAPEEEERLPQCSPPRAATGMVDSYFDFVPDTASPQPRASRQPALALHSLQEEEEELSGGGGSMGMHQLDRAASAGRNSADLGNGRPAASETAGMDACQETLSLCRSRDAFLQSFLGKSPQVSAHDGERDAFLEALHGGGDGAVAVNAVCPSREHAQIESCAAD